MKLAFYIASKGNFLDWIIDAWTGSYGYSHIELVFSNGECYSTSPREGHTRFKNIDLNSGKWVLVDLDITEEEEERIRSIAQAFLGDKYDWRGIFFHQGIGKFIKDRCLQRWKDKLFQRSDHWWCSEIIAFLINVMPFRIPPNELAKFYNLPKV